MTDEKHWCESLYEERATQILLYGRSLGLSHSEAEDVMQETFVALIQQRSAPEKPLHYCLRSFRNRALNYRRGFLRRIARELESSRWFDRDPEETPEERAAMKCLETLPKDQREVILLKIWHEYTFEEIGELLEISPNTAAGRYRYGLSRLRRDLQRESYERSESVRETIAFLDPASTISGS